MRAEPARVARAGIAALLLPALLAGAGCEREAPRPRNVVLIVVDTLRTDHLSAYGYQRDTSPALARLAADGVRFDRAYAPAPWTKPSVASVFTGQYPHRHGLNFVLAKLRPEALTLAERLAEAGFATAGVVSHVFLAHANGFTQGFELFDAREARGHMHKSTAGVTRRARRFLREIGGGDRPFFLFVHYFDPHYAYLRHREVCFVTAPVGRLRGGENIHDLREMGPSLESGELEFLKSLYDEEIRFTDSGVGALLQALTDLGLDDDTLVIATADHGEEFFERGWLGHTRTVHEEVIRVPLIVRVPGGVGSGRVVADPVSLVSLAPTILDYLGVEADESDFQGPSLRPLIEGSTAPDLAPVRSEVRFLVLGRDSVLAEKNAFKHALIDGRHKLIKDFQSGAYELYDLERDPGERENLASSRPELLRRMVETLDRTGRPEVAEPPDDASALDPKEAELLRDLGYVDE